MSNQDRPDPRDAAKGRSARSGALDGHASKSDELRGAADDADAGSGDAPLDPTQHADSRSRPSPWPKLESRHGAHMVLFRPRWDRLRNPRTGEEFDRLVLETPDWVNVVAVTKDRRLVCVHQFRFGSGSITLEIPGGMVDRGEGHQEAALRELQEETGYTSARWRYLGAIEPNPAFHDNLCHHWLAEDCELTHAQGLDSGEDIHIETVPLDDVVKRIEAGDIRHSLVISALSHVLDLRTVRDLRAGSVTRPDRPD